MFKKRFQAKVIQGNFALAKTRLASNPDTAPEVLDKLAEHHQPHLPERVAENPGTGAGTLDKLSSHESADVRGAVTENANTSTETLHTLASDENADVRYRLAENSNTPVQVLETLAQDDNPFVHTRAHDTLEKLKSVSLRADEMLIQEHFAEAEELYSKLSQGLEALLGAQHKEVAAALHKLAAALVGQSKLDEAATIESRANSIIAGQEG